MLYGILKCPFSLISNKTAIYCLLASVCSQMRAAFWIPHLLWSTTLPASLWLSTNTGVVEMHPVDILTTKSSQLCGGVALK